MYSLFLNKILLPLGSLIFSGNYSRYLNQWEKYDSMSEEELEDIQAEKMSEILTYAKTHSPYYRNLKLPQKAALKDFPILTKDILREESNILISDKFEKKKLEKNHSSGSSGFQSFTYMSLDHKFYLRALQTHWWMWGGYVPGETVLQAGISPNRTFPKNLKDLFFRIKYLEAFSLNEKKIRDILSSVENLDPKHIAGYPSALNEIALVAISENKTLAFKSLISYGDKLFPHFEKNFTRAFRNPTIVNTYGCAEGIHMACKVDLPYYYIMSPHVYLEVVDDAGKEVDDGQRGHILVTCLTNLAMPLIRYKIGDMGIMLPKEKYPEHRKYKYPLLQEVTGRETEVIKTPRGNVLIVHSFTGIFEFYENIKQFKVIQMSKSELLIEYISDSDQPLPKSIKNEILNRLEALTDGSMEISLQPVSTISASPSGKPQIIEIRNSQ